MHPTELTLAYSTDDGMFQAEVKDVTKSMGKKLVGVQALKHAQTNKHQQVVLACRPVCRQ